MISVRNYGDAMRRIINIIKGAGKKPLLEKELSYLYVQQIIEAEKDLDHLLDQAKYHEESLSSLRRTIMDRKERQAILEIALNKEISEEEFKEWYSKVSGEENENYID